MAEKPKNLKQRQSENTMKPLQGVKLDKFGEVDKRGWGVVRDLNNRNHLTMDWRLQWDKDEYRQQQLVTISLGKSTAVISRQELERYLRHV